MESKFTHNKNGFEQSKHNIETNNFNKPTNQQQQHQRTDTNNTTTTTTTSKKQQNQQRNKLIRSTESFGNAFENSNSNKIQKALNEESDQNYKNNKDPRKISTDLQGINVMGGGIAAPPIKTLLTANNPPEPQKETEPETKFDSGISQNRQSIIVPMHEKLIEKDETITRKEKTDKHKLLSTSKDKDKAKDQDKEKEKEKSTKPKKESTNKFAERLRRSFRRGEHKSFELKRNEKISEEFQSAKNRTTPPPAHSASDNNNFLVGRPLKKQNSRSSSIFSLSNLPGLSGHINPALLLDSPDESTPPEYAYQNLSSVATTNSSTSLESNFDFSEVTSSQTSIYYWAWQQQTANTTPPAAMGGEVSTNAASSTSSESAQERAKRRLETQSSNKSCEGQQLAAPPPPQLGSSTHAAASRSCSITSESSSVKLTRLHNFLFKSSNESTRSFLGHSNEGFTASSHNSSSGEWEQLGAYGAATTNTSSSGGGGVGNDFVVGSFPEESITDISNALPVESSEGGSYYQYTLTSPNNPFLPEITARTYHSTYEDDLHEVEDENDEELDGNVTSVKYSVGGTRSTQLPTPAYSRAGSQESTHSEGGISYHHQPQGPTPSPASSSSSTPGRHKRKLFSLNSPTRLLHHQHQHQQHHHHHSQQHQQQQQKPQNVVAATTSSSSSPPKMFMETTKFNSANLVRSLNPFLPISSSGSSPKRAPLKQAAVTSPVAVPPDLNAKREEFLRATMKICLVVSPPTSKLQLKSKSLTHLDGIDSMIACHHGPTSVSSTSAALATASAAMAGGGSKTTIASGGGSGGIGGIGGNGKHQPNVSTAEVVASEIQIHQHHHHQYHNTAALIHHTAALLHRTTTTTTTSHKPKEKQRRTSHVTPVSITITASTQYINTTNTTHPPTIYTQAPLQAPKSAPALLSPTITTTAGSSCCHGRICCLGKNTASAMPTVGILNHTTTSHATHQSSSFQSNIDAAVVSSVVNTLSPALACSATPTSAGSTTNIFYYGSSAAAGTPNVSSASNVATHKKKSSFMTRKKPLLTRSEVSSSEYFSVSFCTEIGCQDEEFIQATKGVTLLTALNQALRRRNLSFSQITITDNNPTPSFLDAGTSPLASSLDENTEVENLAGHHLIITERDSSRKTLQKAASFGSRARPPRLLSSASTEETSESGNATGKQIKQRWSGLFGTKNPSQSQLCELLNNYAKNGVPQRTTALNFDHPDLDAALAYLDNMHKSWRDIVESDGMTDTEVKIQTAIWELVTTEVYYIHALQTVTDLFLACLEAVQDERLLADVDQHKLFSNVRDICEANLKFWTHYLYPMVAHSVATREPLRCSFFQEGFVAFAAIFAPYKKYCAEQSTCQFYCKELNRNNALFTSYLAWCESQKMCNRLRLADIIVRPMQRLTKYSLLLAAIKKHMSDCDEIEAVDTMLHSVENFVCSVNNHLTMRQENERLKGVMARIESYDVVDTNNEQLDKLIKQCSQMFDLCAPMKGCPVQQVRHLFMEGDHKFKDNLGKADVHCFLLTDMLLICKTIAKKGLGTLKVIRQPYLTDRLMVHLAPNSNTLNCVYLNEFQVAVTAFTLQCTEAKNWHESIRRAKMIYTRLKQGTGGNWGDSRFGGSSTSGGNADSLGVKKSPMNSSICSHVSSANNSHSGSVEWNDSRNISIDFEKTNSLSSDEGSSLMMGGAHAHGVAAALKNKQLLSSQNKLKVVTNTSSANTLTVQPLNHLGQSLPNLNLHHSHTNLYHTYSNNTLLVPGTTSSHSGNLLLSPSHRGISYPPPSPTRVPLRRGMAFSTSTKNPPLLKTRNITSQNSINWHQIPATPTPPSPQSQHNSPGNISGGGNNTNSSSSCGASVGIGIGIGVGGGVACLQKSLPALVTNKPEQAELTQQRLIQMQMQQKLLHQPIVQLSNQNLSNEHNQISTTSTSTSGSSGVVPPSAILRTTSNETDV